MVTKPAFNALLKILEEPPAHVVFILATTDPQKLPDTIISRTQRFQFRPVQLSKVVAHLSYIANQENIAIEEAALELIAEHGQGSFRDSISLLDQAANYGTPVTAETVGQLIGVPPADLVDQLLSLLGHNQGNKLISLLNQFFEQGYPAGIVASQIAKQLRNQLINGQLSLSPSETLSLLKELIEVPASTKPEQLLEIILLGSCFPTATTPTLQALSQGNETTTPSKLETKAASVETGEKKEPILNKKSPVTEKVHPAPKKEKAKQHNPETASLPNEAIKLSDENWQKVLDSLKADYNTLYGLVRMASLDLSDPSKIQLKFAYAFHLKRLNDPKNKRIVADAIKKVIGRDLIIECLVDKELLSKSKTKTEPKNDLAAISNVFGGGEPIP